ncbi:MAG: hypothetical protein H6754_08625 [Candidatus Omnitrophica bacterium]|nr:hypothetical protein [Candidatus Omnitrophota bacterium]
MATKKCSRCRNRKPLDQFVKNAKSADGLSHYCRPCKKKIMEEYFASPDGKAAKKRMIEARRMQRKAQSKKRK